MIMGFNFTIAIVPDTTNLNRELEYIKSALLYADEITLISPLAYMFNKITYFENSRDERVIFNLINQVLPIAKQVDDQFYNYAVPIMGQFEQLIKSRQYKHMQYIKRLEIQKELKKFLQELCDIMISMVGESQSREIKTLIKSGQVHIEKLENSLGDVDLCVQEYFKALEKSIHSSYPLFDEQSNNLMKAAISENIINLSSTDRKKITHAGLTDNYIQRLPCFGEATISEIIDIKKELSEPLIRFRSKMLDYTDKIQAFPWDKNFQDECQLLYDREVAPTIQEIEECSREGSFIKNLGRRFFINENIVNSTGGLIVSIAAGGVVSTFNNIISSNTAMLTTGGTYLISQIAKAYDEYKENKRNIERKDMYFYYQVGKKLLR